MVACLLSLSLARVLSCVQVAAFAPRPEEPNAWILARVVREKSNGRVRGVSLRLLILVVVLVVELVLVVVIVLVVLVVLVVVVVVLVVLFNQGLTNIKRAIYRLLIEASLP